MNTNIGYKYLSKWDNIPPQAGKQLTEPRSGCNTFTDHLETLQDIAYTQHVYNQINNETGDMWLRVMQVEGAMEDAFYRAWLWGV